MVVEPVKKFKPETNLNHNTYIYSNNDLLFPVTDKSIMIYVGAVKYLLNLVLV